MLEVRDPLAQGTVREMPSTIGRTAGDDAHMDDRDDSKPRGSPAFPERTDAEWKRCYERAHLALILMEGEFEPGTPMTPRCEAPLIDGGACTKGRGHPGACDRIGD